MKIKNPPHPGAILREDILKELGLTVEAAAATLGIKNIQNFSDILNGKSHITPEIAERFEKTFNVNMEMLLRLQSAYDSAQAK